MADGRQSKEFMLASRFLSHDEGRLLSEESGWRYYKSTKVSPRLNSPVDSELGSGATGSDEDDEYDYVSELTRQVAQDMREDYRSAARSIAVEKDEKSCVLVGSPESTLWSPLGSSKGSWEGASLDPSPPPPTSPSGSMEISHSEISSNPHLSDSQTRALQLYKLKQEQITRLESYLRWRREAEPENNVPQFEKKHTDVRPPPVRDSDWRSAFPGVSGSRNGCFGTGVFLPREIEDPPSSSRKKQACSTILIPARVVQALRLHHDKTGTNSRLEISGLPPHQDALMSLRGGVYSLENGHFRSTPPATGESPKGLSLPQEWTY